MIQLTGKRFVYGRDLDGRYLNSPLNKWFNSLKNKNGVGCCSTSDGIRIEDAEWGVDKKTNLHWVIVGGIRHLVPPEALITVPNRAGVAIVWPVYESGSTVIRCFIPGLLM